MISGSGKPGPITSVLDSTKFFLFVFCLFKTLFRRNEIKMLRQRIVEQRRCSILLKLQSANQGGSHGFEIGWAKYTLRKLLDEQNLLFISLLAGTSKSLGGQLPTLPTL